MKTVTLHHPDINSAVQGLGYDDDGTARIFLVVEARAGLRPLMKDAHGKNVRNPAWQEVWEVAQAYGDSQVPRVSVIHIEPAA